MLYKIAEEKGIDLDETSNSEEVAKHMAEREEIDRRVRKSVLTQLCKKYRNLAMPYMEEFNAEMVEQVRQGNKEMHMGLQTPESYINNVATLGDCGEVIRWYMFFIEVKLHRALSQVLEGDEPEDFPKDSDGSAKIAIIAIERSMGAWARLLELLPESEDVALQCLSTLSKLKTIALEKFPEAMNFVRPGFDDDNDPKK